MEFKWCLVFDNLMVEYDCAELYIYTDVKSFVFFSELMKIFIFFFTLNKNCNLVTDNEKMG